MSNKQYFMYGVLVSFQQYLEMDTGNTVEEVLKGDDGIQGVFTGRNGDFMIVGKVLDSVEDNGNPQIIPELNEIEMIFVKFSVNKKYGIHGDFHYYFIANNKNDDKEI